MEKMKAWVYKSPKKIVYEEISIPQCNDNQVLVKIDTACICNGSDPGIFNGHQAYDFEHIFGHEPSGFIVKVGKNVSDYYIGDRVTWWFSVGAFCEYTVVEPANVCMLKLPENISRQAAPVMELVIASSRAIKNRDINTNTKILIIGLGPSGLMMAQRAKALGAKLVVGWDLYELRRNKGIQLGVDYAFDPSTNAYEETKLICDDFDILIDAFADDLTKEEATLTNGIKLCKNGGKLISYGHPEKSRNFNPFNFQSKNLTMEPPENNMNNIRIIAEETLKFILEGKINVEAIVSKVLPLSMADKALELTTTKPNEYLKVILDCNIV